MRRFKSKKVKEVYDSYTAEMRASMMQIRELIFDVAQQTPGVGVLDETLKWGEPSYVTAQSGSGSTVRVDRFDESTVALYFNCRTMLVETFRGMFGDEIKYSKNRALLFSISEPLPEEAIRQCVQMSLCYRINKKKSAQAGNGAFYGLE